MTTTLILTFPLGRYHATPWDRQVNEGAVEVPPSPWRLLRMLYAVWKCRRPDLEEDVVHALLADLAVPPTFYIPAHGISHSRHYYPDAAHGRDRTLDAFAVFGADDQLAVQWAVNLPADRSDALRCIAESVPYFGRADSLCTGMVQANWTPSGHATWKPMDVAESMDGYDEVTSVLAPELPLTVAALLVTPTEVRRTGVRFPRGSRLVAYALERPAEPRTRITHLQPNRRVTALRFDILQTALPPDTDTAIYTDLLRQAAIKQLGENPCGTMLGGKTADDAPMRGGKHAHYLPLIGGRHLTGFVVWIPGGLPDKELAALCDVRKLYDYKRRIQVRVSGIGTAEQIAPELVGPATVWRTVTPITPSRFPKKNRGEWSEFVVAEIHRELRVRGVGRAVDVELIDGPWPSFVRHRPSARLRGDPRQGQARLPGQFVRIRFANAIQGPLALGRLCHFGLGTFTPEG